MAEKKIETKAVVDEQTAEKDMQSKQRANVFAELREFRTQVKSFKVSDLVVPVMSLIVLLLLTTYVYIPMVTSAIEARDERAQVREDVAKLEGLNGALDQIEVSTLQQDLSISRSVIPFSLQVSDFVFYVDSLATEKGLIFREILAGDVQVRGSGEDKGIDPVVRGVNGPLRYSGSLDDITAFLDGLQNASPFLIVAEGIELRRSVEVESWEVSLSVTGYYMHQGSIPEPSIYAPFTPYTKFEDVLNIFEVKENRLEEDTTTQEEN